MKKERRKMSKERNYGIDLLRVVLMYMVCMLHTLGRGGILGASAAGTRGYKSFGSWKSYRIVPLTDLPL